MTKRRVVITGMGAVTPIGNSIDELWNGIRSAKIGIAPITRFDASDFKVKLAAEVRELALEDYLTPKEIRSNDRVVHYALIAASQAAEMAGLGENQPDPYRCSVMVGTASGGQCTLESESVTLQNKGNRAISAFSMPKYLGNMLSGNLAIKYGFKGKSFNISSACATGTHSIGEAFRAVQYGDCDMVMTGGVDSCITPLAVAGFQALTALTTETDPSRASIPFDKDRSGFVIGEGAGIIILEELEHAKARNAHILAEIAGYGATCDAGHITAPDSEGSAEAIRLALKEAGLSASDIDLVNAHGTSTMVNDLMESKAIEKVFGETNHDVPIQSTKSMTGHMLGASGAVETVVCVKEIQDGYIHENVGLHEALPDMKLNYVMEPINREIKCVLNNSLAFGGQNAALIIKRYGEDQ